MQNVCNIVLHQIKYSDRTQCALIDTITIIQHPLRNRFIIGIFEDLPFRNAPDFPDIRLNSCNEIGFEKDGCIHYYIIYRVKVQ